MLRAKRFGLAALFLGSGLVLAGCQAAGNGPPQSTLVNSDKGLTCAKCETTWVKMADRSGKGGRVVGYSWVKKDVCPDCRNAVDNFFATGKLQHACKTCGDNMKVCETH